MAHYVLIDQNNIVIQGFVGKNENDPLPAGVASWEQYYCPPTAKACLRTSYNTRGGVHYADNGEASQDQTKAFRKNYAGMGFKYDEALDAFIPPKPFESWVLDEETCLWQPPVPMPQEEGKMFTWNEDDQAWVEMEMPETPPQE